MPDNTIVISASIPRIMSEKDLLAFLKVDTKTWGIEKILYGKSEGYRKDRKVHWDVKNGKVIKGMVRDSGKLLVVPLFSVKVYLRKKTQEIRTRNEIFYLKKEALSYAPKYKPIKYKKQKGFLYEIAMPDLQLGRLVMAEEAGMDSNPSIYLEKAEIAIRELLSVQYPIERILFLFFQNHQYPLLVHLHQFH